MRKLLLITWMACTTLFFVSCNNDDNNGAASYPFQLRFTDAAGDYE